jgi:hypothetical protein
MCVVVVVVVVARETKKKIKEGRPDRKKKCYKKVWERQKKVQKRKHRPKSKYCLKKKKLPKEPPGPFSALILFPTPPDQENSVRSTSFSTNGNPICMPV